MCKLQTAVLSDTLSKCNYAGALLCHWGQNKSEKHTAVTLCKIFSKLSHTSNIAILCWSTECHYQTKQQGAGDNKKSVHRVTLSQTNYGFLSGGEVIKKCSMPWLEMFYLPFPQWPLGIGMPLNIVSTKFKLAFTKTIHWRWLCNWPNKR